MDIDHLKEHHEKEATYWWFVNKRLLVDRLCRLYCGPPGRLLEVGGGGGMQAAAFARAGWRVIAADVEPIAAGFLREHGLRDVVLMDGGAPWPFRQKSLDLVVMLDILEHLEDDVDALREANRVLKPAGALILSVPANPILYSNWDRSTGHYRRYTRRQLESVVRAGGLEIVRVSFWNMISLLPVALVRGKEHLTRRRKTRAEFPTVPRMANTLLKGWGRLETHLIGSADLPFGLSMIAVLKRPGA